MRRIYLAEFENFILHHDGLVYDLEDSLYGYDITALIKALKAHGDVYMYRGINDPYQWLRLVGSAVAKSYGVQMVDKAIYLNAEGVKSFTYAMNPILGTAVTKAFNDEFDTTGSQVHTA